MPLNRFALAEKGAPTPSDIIFMANTRSSSTLLMHPQDRNVHNKIFGEHSFRDLIFARS